MMLLITSYIFTSTIEATLTSTYILIVQNYHGIGSGPQNTQYHEVETDVGRNASDRRDNSAVEGHETAFVLVHAS
jgi:hypothetical protein